jgi:hypothetical protein
MDRQPPFPTFDSLVTSSDPAATGNGLTVLSQSGAPLTQAGGDRPFENRTSNSQNQPTETYI